MARFPSDGGAGFLIGGFAQKKFEHQSKNTAKYKFRTENMSVQEAIQVGDPRLKAKNISVTAFDDPSIKQIVNDLIETMRSKELLVGLSAPQIGENYKIFVTEPKKTKFRTGNQVDELRVYFNPKIIHQSAEKTTIYEGCGSFLNGQLFGPVKRPKEITVEAIDRKSKKFQLTCDGILARVIQHE